MEWKLKGIRGSFIFILLVIYFTETILAGESFSDDGETSTKRLNNNDASSVEKDYSMEIREDDGDDDEMEENDNYEHHLKGEEDEHDPAHIPPDHGDKDNNRFHQNSHTSTVLRVEEATMPPSNPNEEKELFGLDADEKRDESTKKNIDSRPNIILILTDDQDVELGSMEYMPETLKIFRDEGVEFRHGYTTTPMCCPSRSSLLTGLYVHNHNVYTNNDNCSSVLWREKHEKQTFGAHLWSSGYYTSYVGKYLNKYDGSHIPYGWDEWNGLLMNSRFYNYTVNMNGRKKRFGNDYFADYFPDFIANETLDFLSRVGKDETRRPFLLVSSFPSPHGPEDSAPQYSNLFFNETPHHTPSYNYAPNLDKQWILRKTDSMTPLLKDFTNLLMTKRLQTLQSVDKAVKDIMDKLRITGLDQNTYVFYTSDHGYHVGQFGLVKGKSMPYEFDIRVPFFLHGPSSAVKPGTKILEPVLNIDIAPTFLDIAGVTLPEEMDGRSMLPLIQRYGPKYTSLDEPFVWKDVFLIESSGRREITTTLTTTPSASQSPKKAKKLRDDKRKLFFDDNESVRMTHLCLLHPHPCLPGQKKYCRKDKDSRAQFKKCRQSDFLQNPYSDVHINDPLYQVMESNGTFSSQHNLKRCSCRFRRSTNLNLDPETKDFDWDIERKMIDDEIELLKKRIDDLRHKRRQLRRKWISEHHPELTTHISESEREGKSQQHKDDDKKGDSNDGKVFSAHDFEDPENEESPISVTEVSEDNVGHNDDKDEHDSFIDGHEDPEGHEDDIDDENSEDELDEKTRENNDELEKTPISVPTVSADISQKSDDPLITNVPFEVPITQEENPRVVESTISSTEIKDTTSSKHNIEASEPIGLDIIDANSEIDRPHQPQLKTRGRGKHNRGGKNRHKQRQYGMSSFGGGGVGYFGGHDSDTDLPFEEAQCDCYQDPRWLRHREREERKRKKLLSKIRKKQKYMKRIEDPDVRKQAETCGTEEKMNCFWHDRDHWKTAPFWNNEPFCFCMNSNNNTYSCLRSVNATHNYLYCQFVTGFKMYFDLTQDPYQLKNAIGTLPASQEDWMLVQLIRLKKCKGKEDCWGEIDENDQAIQSSIWEQIFGRWPRNKKKKRGHRKRQF